jgi:hypothetical protein
VSEVATKVFKNWANLDPQDLVVKDKWGTITHLVLIVDWTGSAERYVLDVGFGGDGCPIPYACMPFSARFLRANRCFI